MSRTTSKDITMKHNEVFETKFQGFDVVDLYNKLKQKEDDDEELGIDSHILFKAIKQGYIYIKGSLENPNSILKVNARICQSNNCLCWNIPQIKKVKEYYFGHARHFEGYGKTWALTKEELEK